MFDYFEAFCSDFIDKDNFDLECLRSFYELNLSHFEKNLLANQYNYNNKSYQKFDYTGGSKIFKEVSGDFYSNKTDYKSHLAVLSNNDLIRIMKINRDCLIVQDFKKNEFTTYYFDTYSIKKCLENISYYNLEKNVKIEMNGVPYILQTFERFRILPDITFNMKEEKNGFVFEKKTLGNKEIKVIPKLPDGMNLYGFFYELCNLPNEIEKHNEKVKLMHM